MQFSPQTIKADGVSTSTATATVTDANGNPAAGDAVSIAPVDRSVRVGHVADNGNGTYTALVTSTNTPETITVIATDSTPSPSVLGKATLSEVTAPSLVKLTTMRWKFYYTPKYTMVQLLALNNPPVGGTVLLACKGRGCPFSTRTSAVPTPKPCVRSSKYSCPGTVTYDLTSTLSRRHLDAGTRLTVAIMQRGWIGKYYVFMINGGRPPTIQISCLPPGETRPGVGCR